MSRFFISILLGVSFLLLLALSVRASLVRDVFDNGSLMNDVWFQTTLFDAYLGFLTVYVWIAWKERTFLRRLVWFLLVMAFGNMAISAYLLWQLFRLPRGSDLSMILTLRNEPATVGHSNVHQGES